MLSRVGGCGVLAVEVCNDLPAPSDRSERDKRGELAASGVAGREKTGPEPQPERLRGPTVSWPEALRTVRAWLEPWIMPWRYWVAFSDLHPSPGLRTLLERVFSGKGLYLYVR